MIVGQGFANNLTQYDDFSSGARFTGSDLVPFGLTVERFDVRFETGDVQRGAARQFRAEVQVTDRPGAAPRREALEVNRPLQIEAARALIGHGLRPLVTVKDGEGNVAFSGRCRSCQDATSPGRGDQGPDGRPETPRLPGLLPADRGAGRAGPTVGLSRTARPGAVHHTFCRTPKTETGGRRTCTPGHHRSDPAAWATTATWRGSLDRRQGVSCRNGKGSIQWTAGSLGQIQVSDTPGVTILAGRDRGCGTGLCLSLFVVRAGSGSGCGSWRRP